MAAENTEVIPDIARDPSDLALILEAVHRIDHRTAQILDKQDALEFRLNALAGAWEQGGLRGLRQAMRTVRSA